MHKKIKGNFHFFTKTVVFLSRPVFGHGRLGHPQSLEYYFLFFISDINVFVNMSSKREPSRMLRYGCGVGPKAWKVH